MTDCALASEYIPAWGETRQELVLLHGWASSREIWRPLLGKLRQWANITLVDLPGCTTGGADIDLTQLEALQRAILACAPPRAIYVGWSLGGLLAGRIAFGSANRVSALITVCTNPRFIESADWPGMAVEEFAAFRIRLATNPIAALRRFDNLQASGSSQQRATRLGLTTARQTVNPSQLLAGLGLLESLDLRSKLASLTVPQLHVFGQCDALVPATVSVELSGLLENHPTACVTSLPGVCHAAPLDCSTGIATAIHDFLTETGQLADGCEMTAKPAKADVSESFSRAARHYDSAAQLQREVGTRLLEDITKPGFNPESVLDLGCGTGYFYPALKSVYPQAKYLGLDLAPGMVDFARAQFPHESHWLVADAEQLPIATHSIDLVFSSLAIQWCHSPRRLFAELDRVLRPGGRCVFTSLGPGTLKELRASWGAVDTHQHVNTFLPASDLEEAAADLPCVSLKLHNQKFQMEYDRVRELLNELKTLGAHNMNRGRQTGLTGRRALQGMLAAYESWREGGKLPATYDVLYGVLEKT